MIGYSWVSIVSLLCYLYLLITLFPYRKVKPMISSFIELLLIMILWNGGSLFMRMQLFSTVYLWHHMSLFGMMMLPVGYFHFVTDFLEQKAPISRKVWLAAYLLIFLLNCITNILVPLPEVLTVDGKTQFLYHYTWHIYMLFLPIAATLFQLFLIVRRHCRGNHIAFQQLRPLLCGIAALLAGHVLATLPMFVGFPIDMASGVVNVLFLFYALYKKKLFPISVLLSNHNFGFSAIALVFLAFAQPAKAVKYYLVEIMGMQNGLVIAMLIVMFICLIVGTYFIFKLSASAIFSKTEQKQKAAVARFSEEITYLLNLDAILQSLADTIQDAVEVDRLYILAPRTDGNFYIEYTIKPLEERNFFFRADHPMINYLRKQKHCISVEEFTRMTMYRSMWESEKSLLTNLDIDTFIPLLCDDELVCFAMVSCKDHAAIQRPSTLQFFHSIADIGAVAVKNAYHYEKAVENAQKDPLTGLINYKFFLDLLDREFEQNKETLSLCLIDIDGFRLYNQLYGTAEGDNVLRRIAGILLSGIGDNGYAARVDGDEFALILPGYDIYSAKCLADSISQQINAITVNSRGDTAHNLTVSIGICASPYMASSSKELYRNADSAVYTVKRTGKNAVLMYSADSYHREPTPPKHKSGYNENANTIYALTAAIDTKDHYTFQHSRNVAHYASELAKAAGMSPDLVEIVREAGLLHDIGKIGIREDILNKPGKLTTEEYEIMKGHVENGVNIIQHLPSLDYVIPAVLSHHERYDGKGYPRRLTAEEIPITGRILSIADAFDAITSKRNYKNASTPEEAVHILREEAGKQFDPNLAFVFIDLVESGSLTLCVQNSASEATADPFSSFSTV